jgi:hypothetical protein
MINAHLGTCPLHWIPKGVQVPKCTFNIYWCLEPQNFSYTQWSSQSAGEAPFLKLGFLYTKTCESIRKE